MTIFDKTDLQEISFSAQKGSEDFRFQYEKYDRITNVTDIPIFSIVGASKKFQSDYQGYIGIAPYANQYTNKVKSFIFNLKQKNLIDHIVIAMYVEMEQGNSSVIKFGSYDPDALTTELVLFRTVASSTWSLQARNF